MYSRWAAAIDPSSCFSFSMSIDSMLSLRLGGRTVIRSSGSESLSESGSFWRSILFDLVGVCCIVTVGLRPVPSKSYHNTARLREWVSGLG